MTVTTKTITGTITNASTNLYTTPAGTVSKIINLATTNNSSNSAVLNIESVNPSVDNFETYTAQGAVYSGVSYSITTQESQPYGVAFNDTGTKMYVVGQTTDNIFEYNLSIPYDISTVSYSGASIASGVSNPADISFGNNGLKMYVGWSNTFGVGREFDLSTAYDITTATLAATVNYQTFPGIEIDFYIVGGFSFNDDGTKLYVKSSYGSINKLNQFTLSTPWSIPSLNIGSRVILTLTGTGYSKAVPSSDGKRFYYIDDTNDSVREIELTTAWDLTTATNNVRSFSVSSQTTNPLGIALSNSDSDLFLIDFTTDSVLKYNLSFFGDLYINPWVLSDISFAHKSPLLSAQAPQPYGLDFKSDGTKLYVAGFQQVGILQYSLSEPFDVSTAVYDGISTPGSSPQGYDLQFKADGTAVFVNRDLRYIDQYNLSTAWDLSTLSSRVNQLDTIPPFSNAGQWSFCIKPDGTRLYVTGTTSPYVQQYNLSSPWDLSTASASVVISGAGTNNYGIGFADNGLVMFLMSTGNVLQKWNLSTAWEIDTATFDSSYDLDLQDAVAGDVDTIYAFKLIQSKSQISCMDYRDDDILTFNLFSDAGIGNAPSGKLSLAKNSTVFADRTNNINAGCLVLSENNNIEATSTENIDYSLTVQELTGDISSGFKVASNVLLLGTMTQNILTATEKTRIYGCQVTNVKGTASVSFTTYLNNIAIVTKTVEVGDSVLGITPGLSLEAGDQLTIQPSEIGAIQVSLSYEEYQ